MAHRIYWRRVAEPGSAVTIVLTCPGCRAHPPGHVDVLGTLASGRAAWYADSGGLPAWLCGWGLPGYALLAALRSAARDPNAVAGWVTREGRRASQHFREGA